MSTATETVILPEDALLIAATAAQAIVKRAAMGGTDAMAYDVIRDAITDAMASFIIDDP